MKISLKKKKLATGKTSLYIEYYNKGGVINRAGKKVHNRDFEYLQLYLINEPTPSQKIENKETLKLAEDILTLRKADFIQGKHSIKSKQKTKNLFLDYYDKLKEERYESKGNYDNWDAALKHIERYCPPNKSLGDIDKEFIKGFKRYLSKEATTKSGTPLAQNSKYTYFNKFRAAIREAFNDGHLDKNYVTSVKGFQMGESKREYLTHSELEALVKAECKYPVLKNAFLFSCLTGLRWSDINKMMWREVRDEDNSSRVIFKQQKTDGLEYLYISKQARQLLGERDDESARVFVGLKYGAHFNAQILRWCMNAGITKHITFHSGRHTNAVLLLENGADIYTVSKRLGHKELRTTEIYAKIVDKKMKEAASIIPELDFELL